MQITDDKLEKLIEMLANNYSYRSIAESLGITRHTVEVVANKLKYDVSRLKDEEYQKLYERYHMNKKARIELFGEDLLKIEKELSKRNLSDLSDGELLELKGKTVARLERLYSPVNQQPVEKTTEGILNALEELLSRIQAGEAVNGRLELQTLQAMADIIGDEQVTKKLAILAMAIDTNEQVQD